MYGQGLFNPVFSINSQMKILITTSGALFALNIATITKQGVLTLA
jgi:hypothetical protein